MGAAQRASCGTAGPPAVPAAQKVEVEVDGLLEVLRCRIQPQLIRRKGDHELLEDLVAAAVNRRWPRQSSCTPRPCGSSAAAGAAGAARHAGQAGRPGRRVFQAAGAGDGAGDAQENK